MTTTCDPRHPQYLVERDVREELTRVFDLCHGCRLCFNLCPSFPSLFDFVDEHDGVAEAMSHAEQDQVVDECYQCKLCYVKCPYVPLHERDLDFPRLMMRARAERHQRVSRGTVERATDQFLGQTDIIGKISTKVPKLVNAVAQSPGTVARKVMQATTGVHADRLLPPYAKLRFSTWSKRHKAEGGESARAKVSIFPTCFIEYMSPSIGRALVAIAEHNDISCSVPGGTRCCGAPWLHAGDIDRFQKVARRNVAALAAEVREGKDVLVVQPTCAYVIKKDYPIYAPGVDADLVSRHTFDGAEYGDCHLANTAITEETGRQVLHPLQIFARAYGKDDGE